MSSPPSLPSAKLPFATYDLVVYLGGAAFLMVALGTYFTLSIPILPNPDSFSDYIYSIFLIIGLLFSLYVIGHAVAYLSSIFVEGLSTTTFGYPSSVYKYRATGVQGRRAIRSIFWRNSRSAFKNRAWRANILRFAFALPIYIGSALVASTRNTGFASSKVPHSVGQMVDANLSKMKLAETDEDGQWFKVVEHYVNFNFDNASRRMYNYLLIYGTLRTATFVMLIAFWLEMNHIMVTRFGWVLVNVPSYIHVRDRPGTWGVLLTLSAVACLCYFCFIKFNRRYFEEAMLAFALCERTRGQQAGEAEAE